MKFGFFFFWLCLFVWFLNQEAQENLLTGKMKENTEIGDFYLHFEMKT